MDTGDLNRLVLIQKPGAAVDEWNQPVPADDNWVDVCRPWANIKHPNGVQAIKADADVSVVRASICILYRTDIDASMRVVHGSVIYGISAVLPNEVDRDFTYLVCEAVK